MTKRASKLLAQFAETGGLIEMRFNHVHSRGATTCFGAGRFGKRHRPSLQCAFFLAVAALVGMDGAIAQGPPREASLSRQSILNEVELARSAAPAPISEHATVYTLRNGRYDVTKRGSNGFTCLVLRDSDRRSQEPVCLDPEWTRCQLPEYMKEAELRQRGMSEDQIASELDQMRRNGVFPNPQRSGIAYMASPQMRGMFDVLKDGRIQPHVMIYAAGATNAQIGVNSVTEARRLHIPFVSNEGRPDAHIISPTMTYTDGTRFADK